MNTLKGISFFACFYFLKFFPQDNTPKRQSLLPPFPHLLSLPDPLLLHFHQKRAGLAVISTEQDAIRLGIYPHTRVGWGNSVGGARSHGGISDSKEIFLNHFISSSENSLLSFIAHFKLSCQEMESQRTDTSLLPPQMRAINNKGKAVPLSWCSPTTNYMATRLR